jgi:hypothetical protein
VRVEIAFLMLGHSRQNVNRQAVGLGEVHGGELDTGLHQVRDEGHVTDHAVQLGDYEGR